MNKRISALSLFFFVPLLATLSFFTAYQIYYHGLVEGLHLGALFWSMYVLCVPAAHGNIWLGFPSGYLLHQRIFSEPICWFAAGVLNILSIMITPQIYQESIFTFLLYRILITPQYWIILIIAACGTWFRFMCRSLHTARQRRLVSIIRYIIFLIGLFTLIYLTHCDLVVLINAAATG